MKSVTKILTCFLFLSIFISCQKGIKDFQAQQENSTAQNNSNNENGHLKQTKTPTVTICEQTWMLNNLDVTKYRNGDDIPQVTDKVAWNTLTTGAWCYYENNSANGTTYGKLYNWYAVNDPRGLAPAGWHVPSDAEWTILETCLGGATVAGGKMKETGTVHWTSPNTGATNSSGFTGLPGGYRSDNGTFFFVSGHGGFWSASERNTALAWLRGLAYNEGNVERGNFHKQTGFSVRAVRD